MTPNARLNVIITDPGDINYIGAVLGSKRYDHGEIASAVKTGLRYKEEKFEKMASLSNNGDDPSAREHADFFLKEANRMREYSKILDDGTNGTSLDERLDRYIKAVSEESESE